MSYFVDGPQLILGVVGEKATIISAFIADLWKVLTLVVGTCAIAPVFGEYLRSLEVPDVSVLLSTIKAK